MEDSDEDSEGKSFVQRFFSSKKGFVTSFKSFTFNILCSGILLIFSTYPAGGSSKRYFLHI